MSFAYFDTSALVKRYVREQGSAEVVSLLSRFDCLSSAMTPVELLSALRRRHRSGDLTDEDFSTLINRIRSERTRWELVALTETVLSRAEDVVQGPVSMRALDAIHVASSMVFEAVIFLQVPFVTGDARQAEAASRLGLRVVRVG